MDESADKFLDVEDKIRRKNQILFSKDSLCLQELLHLIESQDRRTLIDWALDCAELPMEKIRARDPAETRPMHCLIKCRAWSQGDIKMAEAKGAILACHDAAKEQKDPIMAALCHAVAQAGSTVHTPRHAPGLLFYELTAVVLEHGSRRYEEAVLAKIRYYRDRLLFWQAPSNQMERKWAGFLRESKSSSLQKQAAERKGEKDMETKNWRHKLTDTQREELLRALKERFEQNQGRHKLLKWERAEAALKKDPEKLQSLYAMEATGGEPDVIGEDPDSGRIIFCDCSLETPSGRRKISYDEAAKDNRKHGKPESSAKGMAEEMGIELLTEKEYLMLQKLGNLDLKSSSWLDTPKDIREKGGALYGDCRYGRVFIYHNGAESWYSSRGFRGMLKV